MQIFRCCRKSVPSLYHRFISSVRVLILYVFLFLYCVVSQNIHCLLEADLSCAKELLRREIYPIVIFIKICERNIKKLK